LKLPSWEVPKALAAGLQPLYVILGEEPLLALEAADAVRAAARAAGFDERVPLYVEPGFDWNSLAAAGASGSLFGSRRLLDLKVPRGKVDAAGSRALVEYASDPPPDALLLVTAPGSERRAGNTAWAKAAAKAGVLVECKPVPARNMPRWVAERLRRSRIAAPREAAALIAEYAQGNLSAASQAIERLALLAVDRDADMETVREAVADEARYGLFDVVDAALRGDASTVMRMLVRLRETGAEPPLLLWAAARELRVLAAWAWADAEGAPRPQVWSSRRSLVAGAARRRSAGGWRSLLRQAAEIDRIVKGRAAGNVWTEMERLLLAMAGRRTAEAA